MSCRRRSVYKMKYRGQPVDQKHGRGQEFTKMKVRLQAFYRNLMRKAGGNIVTEVQKARGFIRVKYRVQEGYTDKIRRAWCFFRPIVGDKEKQI